MEDYCQIPLENYVSDLTKLELSVLNEMHSMIVWGFYRKYVIQVALGNTLAKVF